MSKNKAKREPSVTSGISESTRVDEFMSRLRHPLADVAAYIRKMIAGMGMNIGEGIFWNAPVFFYAGKMKPFDAKEYRRYIVGFNFFKKDSVRLIFLRGAKAQDPKGILEGDYKDGRRLVTLRNIEEAKAIEKDLKKIIKDLVSSMR